MINAGSDAEYSRSTSIQSNRMAVKDKFWKVVLATFIAALGPLSFGYCLGYSSSALVDLQNKTLVATLRLTKEQGSWFSVSFFEIKLTRAVMARASSVKLSLW